MSTYTLYCFPPAGGTASAYDGWRPALAPSVEVRPVTYPGRGARRREPLTASFGDLVRDSLDLLHPLPDRYALFGHSMGALVAFEVARVLTAGQREPAGLARLFVAACAAPAVLAAQPAQPPPPTDEELLNQLRRDERLPYGLRSDPDLLELALPALRADFAASANYRPSSTAPLSCPISVLGGRYDRSTDRAELDRWHECTDRGTTTRLLPAGHDLLGDLPGVLHRVVIDDLGLGSSRRHATSGHVRTRRPVHRPVHRPAPEPRTAPGAATGGPGAVADPARLRAEVRALLRRPDLRAEIERCSFGDPEEDLHAERTYRELGARGLLAANWPREYGGLDLRLADAAVVAEEMVRHGVPDTPRVNTVDNAGGTVLRAGTPEQRRALLPRMASGELGVAVLYTERGAGSDLSGLRCTATQTSYGWTLSGTKIWNAKTAAADYGMCLARTRRAGNPYAGLTLFLVPLSGAGVTVTRIPALNDEPFYRVDLDRAPVGPDARIGPVGEAWSLVTAALGMERTGLCYAARARRWLTALDTTWECAGARDREVLATLDRDVETAELLAWRAVAEVEREPDTVAAAGAKWFASEVAARVAVQAHDLLITGVDIDPAVRAVLSRAARESPGLTLSAGTSEMMLNTVAAHLADLTGGPR